MWHGISAFRSGERQQKRAFGRSGFKSQSAQQFIIQQGLSSSTPPAATAAPSYGIGRAANGGRQFQFQQQLHTETKRGNCDWGPLLHRQKRPLFAWPSHGVQLISLSFSLLYSRWRRTVMQPAVMLSFPSVSFLVISTSRWAMCSLD